MATCQILTVVSSLAVATYVESELHATSDTPCVCPSSVRWYFPVWGSQMHTVQSAAVQ